MHHALRPVVQVSLRMSKTRVINDRPRQTYSWCRGAHFGFLVLLGLSSLSLAQGYLPPPPALEPTIDALGGIQRCGESITRSSSDISSQLLEAHRQLTFGLLKGGYSGGGGYKRSSDWSVAAPPKEYVEDLAHEARWCLEVANILNTRPEEQEAAKQVLESIANDLNIKVKDCRKWGAGRLITVIANTVKNGQPDPGWTVMYKWVSVSGLNSSELSFPQVSTPTSKALPPGVYSVYATKQVGATLEKTQPISVSAFQDAKVKCEIPVP